MINLGICWQLLAAATEIIYQVTKDNLELIRSLKFRVPKIELG